MKKLIIFISIFIFSCTSNSQVVDCDFDVMNINIQNLITQLQPLTSCKQAVGPNEFIAYRIKSENFEIKISTSNLDIVNLNQQKDSNNEHISLKDFFSSIYTKNALPLNEYSQNQKEQIKKARTFGIIEISNGTAYFRFNATSGPFKNSASIVFDDNQEEYWDIISEDRSAITSLLLGNSN